MRSNVQPNQTVIIPAGNEELQHTRKFFINSRILRFPPFLNSGGEQANFNEFHFNPPSILTGLSFICAEPNRSRRPGVHYWCDWLAFGFAKPPTTSTTPLPQSSIEPTPIQPVVHDFFVCALAIWQLLFVSPGLRPACALIPLLNEHILSGLRSPESGGCV